MKTRIISGAVLAVVTVAVILIGGPVLAAVLLLCSLVAMNELMKALGVITEEKKFPPVAIAAYVGCVIYYIAVFLGKDVFYGEVAAIVITAIVSMYVLFFGDTRSEDVTGTVFSFVYSAFMLSFIYLIRAGSYGERYVWMVFASSWIADTCAYFTEYFLGKHKMAPVLSPKKTIEGAAGGIIGAGLAGLLLAKFLFSGNYLWQCFLICAVGAVISIVGDLAASAIKRDRGIKDYGKLIPGHGGIMDRFDSVIFTAPVIYLLVHLLLRFMNV